MTAPALARPLDRPSVSLLQAAADGRLAVLLRATPEIDRLFDMGLLTPDGLWWALAPGVKLCQICGQPTDSAECNACVIADDISFSRSQDI
jgi:hypothetical protein